MTMSNDMHNHHHAEELLEDYLLGTLNADDTAWMEAHVRNCPRCVAEIAPLIAAVQALPYSAPEPDVPMSDDLWDRIERSIAPPAPLPVSPVSPVSIEERQPERPPERTGWTAREWLAIAAVALLSLLGGTLLGQALPQFLGEDEGVAEQVIAIEFTDPEITASAQLRYLPDEQVFVLEVTGLPELPEGQVYQAWLIDEAGPVPTGVMAAETGEFATAGNVDAYQAFAITVEQGPLGNPAPTSDPIMVASLEEPDPA